jgi:ABC-type nitrate/sulfonate/bicarbonate transport system substrate-binding protein
MIDYYDAQLFVTSPNVKTAADLTGKTYAGTSAAGAATLCVKQTMDHFNVTNYQTKLVDSVPNMLAALTNGAVSGYCSQPPASIDLQSKGYNVVWNLTTAKVEAGQVGIITTAAEIKNHPDVVQAFVDSVQKVLNSEKDPANKDKLVAEWAKAIGGNYTTAEWDSTYDYYTQQVTGPDMVPTVGLLSDPQKYLTASVPAAAKLDLNSIIDPTFAEQAKTIK